MLSLGLPLETVRNAAPILERARQSDPAILDLIVLGDSGRIAHSTSALGVYEDILADLSYSATVKNLARSKGLIVGYSSLRRTDGKTVGTVAVIYSDQERTTRILATAARLFIRVIEVHILASILSALFFLILLRQPIRSADKVENMFDDFEKDTWRQAATDKPNRRATLEKGLKGDLKKAERKYQTSCLSVDSAMADGHRI